MDKYLTPNQTQNKGTSYDVYFARRLISAFVAGFIPEEITFIFPWPEAMVLPMIFFRFL